MASYSAVQKDDKQVKPLQAAGLAVELAWKASSKVGFGMVQASTCETISLSGNVKHKQGNRWVEASDPLSLQLRPQDSALAFDAFNAQSSLVAAFSLNVWAVDRAIPGKIEDKQASHDLVAAFIGEEKPVHGMVTVEIKLMSAAGYPWELEKRKREMVSRFAELKKKPSQSAYQALLLLTCKVQNLGGGHWGSPIAEAYLWDGLEWQTLKGKPGSNLLLMAKQRREVTKVLNSLEWFRRRQGPPVAKVAQFLQKMEKDCHNVGQRVKIYNKALRADGVSLKITKVRWSGGSAPWCGTRRVFRKLFKHVQQAQGNFSAGS